MCSHDMQDFSWKTTLLLPKKDTIRGRYKDHFLQETSVFNEGVIQKNITYQPNLASIIVECYDVPNYSFRQIDDCVTRLSQSEKIFKPFLTNTLIVRRRLIQPVLFATTVHFFQGYYLAISIPLPFESYDLDTFVTTTCTSLLSMIQAAEDSGFLQQCHTEAKENIKEAYKKGIIQITLTISGKTLPLSFNPKSSSAYQVAREFCLNHLEILMINSLEMLSSCIFPVKYYLERTYYPVETIRQWSLHEDTQLSKLDYQLFQT